MQQIVVLDTSVLCCWLQVPGKETAGSGDQKWNFARIDDLLKRRLNDGCYLVLPLATVLETGNHISQAQALRFEVAKELCRLLNEAIDGNVPWTAFIEQAVLFTPEKLKSVVEHWPALAAGGTSIGDYLIIDVARYYSDAGMKVEILTGDEGLKAYEPVQTIAPPRRRSGN
jgi:hypothetical protein